MTSADEPTVPRDEHVGPPPREAGQPPTKTGELGLLGRWHEYVTLSRARGVSARLTDADRPRLSQAVAVATQKREAAESLWYAGHRAEGLRLISQAGAWAFTARALCEDTTTGDDPDPPSPPILDAEIDASHEAAFHGTLSEVQAVLRVATQGVAPPKTLRRRRWMRVAKLGLGFVALAAAIALWIYEPPHFEASSTNEQAEWPSRFAIDGSRETEWQSHDRARPTLTVKLVPPRTITAIRLLNGHNRWFNDRAVQRYRLELVQQGEILTTVEGEFEELTPTAEWVTHELPGIRADHIRFVVLSYHGLGAALAELEVVERPAE